MSRPFISRSKAKVVSYQAARMSILFLLLMFFNFGVLTPWIGKEYPDLTMFIYHFSLFFHAIFAVIAGIMWVAYDVVDIIRKRKGT